MTSHFGRSLGLTARTEKVIREAFSVEERLSVAELCGITHLAKTKKSSVEAMYNVLFEQLETSLPSVESAMRQSIVEDAKKHALEREAFLSQLRPLEDESSSLLDPATLEAFLSMCRNSKSFLRRLDLVTCMMHFFSQQKSRGHHGVAKALLPSVSLWLESAHKDETSLIRRLIAVLLKFTEVDVFLDASLSSYTALLECLQEAGQSTDASIAQIADELLKKTIENPNTKRQGVSYPAVRYIDLEKMRPTTPFYPPPDNARYLSLAGSTRRPGTGQESREVQVRARARSLEARQGKPLVSFVVGGPPPSSPASPTASEKERARDDAHQGGDSAPEMVPWSIVDF